MNNQNHRKQAETFLGKFSSKNDAVIAANEIIELLSDMKLDMPNEKGIDGYGWRWAAIIEELVEIENNSGKINKNDNE